MFEYLCVCVGACLISFFQKNIRGLKLSFTLIAILLSVRYDFGSDYMEYLNIFNILNSYTLIDSLTATRYEPGWAILCHVFKPFGFFYMVAFLTVVELYCFYFLIKKHVSPQYYWFAILILVLYPSFLLTYSSMMRQTAAIVLFIFSLEFSRNKKILPALFLALLATQMHRTAFILLPFPFIAYLNPISLDRRKMVLLLFIIVLICIYAEVLFIYLFDNLLLFKQFALYSNYVDRDNNTSFGIGDLLGIIYLSLLLLFQRRQPNNMKNYILIYSLYLPFILFNSIAPMLSRLAFYFLSLQVICYPALASIIRDCTLKYLFMLLVILYAVYSLYALTQTEWGSYFFEYKTVFNHLSMN